MSHQYGNYRDPYAEQGAEYLDDRGHPTAGPIDGQRAGPDEYYQYNQYANTPGMEKTTPADVDHDIGGTERPQPGRQNLGGPPMSSFAAMGPPPRSTGILRMWRKDERGKQWTRVSMHAEVGWERGHVWLPTLCWHRLLGWMRARVRMCFEVARAMKEARNSLTNRVAVLGVLVASSCAALPSPSSLFFLSSSLFLWYVSADSRRAACSRPREQFLLDL